MVSADRRRAFNLDLDNTGAAERGGLISFANGVAKFGIPANEAGYENTESVLSAKATLWFCGVQVGRKYLLLSLHSVCFLVHLIFFIVTLALGAGKDMTVKLYRMKPEWQSVGANGFTFGVEETGATWFRLDTTCALFFGLSAFFHGIWASLGWFPISNYLLWHYLDDCLAWWRWLEYSLSASLMLMCLCVSVAVRNEAELLYIFVLCFITQACGFATELYSRPAAAERDDRGDVTKYDYDRWQGWPKETKGFPLTQRISNYVWRMLPHFFGFIPYAFAWLGMLGPLLRQVDQLPSGQSIPAWVFAAILGTFLMFSTFTVPQWVWQWVAPKHYWKTEVVYCILSLVSKTYLGTILLWNVLLADSFDAAVAPTNTSA